MRRREQLKTGDFVVGKEARTKTSCVQVVQGSQKFYSSPWALLFQAPEMMTAAAVVIKVLL